MQLRAGAPPGAQTRQGLRCVATIASALLAMYRGGYRYAQGTGSDEILSMYEVLQGTTACERWECGTASRCPAAEASGRWRMFVAIGAAWV